MLVCVAAVVLFVTVAAFPETHHFIQIGHQGERVPMDVTYDSDENTVLIVIGDVSRYRGSIQTVNLQDFNSGYGVRKDINRKTCLLGRAPLPKARPEVYRVRIGRCLCGGSTFTFISNMAKMKGCGQYHASAYCPENTGVTDEVHGHWLDINPVRMTQENITSVAGQRIADFCSDYATYFVTASPLGKEKRDTRSTTTNWCVLCTCIYDSNQYQKLI